VGLEVLKIEEIGSATDCQSWLLPARHAPPGYPGAHGGHPQQLAFVPAVKHEPEFVPEHAQRFPFVVLSTVVSQSDPIVVPSENAQKPVVVSQLNVYGGPHWPSDEHACLQSFWGEKQPTYVL
jgi:hypothetical protein